MATYKLDQYIAEADIDPFELDLGGDRGVVTITAPTSEAMVEITETPINQTSRIFELLCGEDQFDKVWEAVRYLPAIVLQSIILDMLKHFKIFAQVSDIQGGSRASRRSLRSTARPLNMISNEN
jgi:hypothetical protein